MDKLYKREELVCDFCSLPEISWSYPVTEFEQRMEVDGKVFDNVYLGDWAACDKCHDLIEAGDKEGLLDRCFLSEHSVYKKCSAEENVEYRKKVTVLHEEFFAMRSGPPITEEEYQKMIDDEQRYWDGTLHVT